MTSIGFYTLLLSLHVALYDPATSQHPTDAPVWNSPCTLTQPATARGQMEAPAQLLPLNYILRTMTDAARLARHRARNTLRALVSSEIRDQWVIQYLNQAASPKGFPPLHGHYSSQSLAESLAQDYERVSAMAVFVEQAEFDTNVMSYRPLLRMLYYDVSDLLCWLEQASLTVDQTVNYNISRSIMEDSSKNLTNQSYRDQRNFVILRDTVTLLHDLVQHYSRVRT
ncbi:hypothetical protein C0Q70_08762 [Pomacea canaliculata]|uniref:Uncharacterized protein n=1 Tax=Pomacea canaliculata TaxID=400727 RepID=A0A2T7P7W8_POMCA|nr:hypothetical protein C0Q70_08762 [Pomacea canaliculata]